MVFNLEVDGEGLEVVVDRESGRIKINDREVLLEGYRRISFENNVLSVDYGDGRYITNMVFDAVKLTSLLGNNSKFSPENKGEHYTLRVIFRKRNSP